MMHVYGDESGYTGQNLYDRDQRVFIYASHCIPEDFCSEIKRNCFPKLTGPMKHTALRKRNIVGLLDALRMIFDNHSSNVFCAVAEKQFVSACKIVDLIIEDVFHDAGIDLYEGHAAKNYATVLYTRGNALLGSAEFEILMQSFIRFVKDRDADSLGIFSSKVSHASSTHSDIQELLQPVAYWIRNNSENIEFFPDAPLCLSSSEAVLSMQRWSKRINEKFTMHCDVANVLANDIDYIKRACYVDGAQQNEFGYGSNTFLHPTNCVDVVLERDEDSIQIQVADIIAGAFNCFASHNLAGVNSQKKYAESIGSIIDGKDLDFHIINCTGELEPDIPTPPGVKKFDDFVKALFPA